MIFSRILTKVYCRNYSSTCLPQKFKVVIAGASGEIGRPLGLILKQNPDIKELALYDNEGVESIAADLNQIDTNAVVTAFEGTHELPASFCNSDLIVFTADIQSATASATDLFKTNAKIVRNLAYVAAAESPNCAVVVATEPVNSLVPLVHGALKLAGHRNPRKVFGVSYIDTMRARIFLARLKKVDPQCICVSVIGGHSAGTMTPLFSQATPEDLCITSQEAQELTKQITLASVDIQKNKRDDNGGSSAMSMAYAAGKLCSSILRGLKGEKAIVDTAFVRSNLLPKVKYFSSLLVLGKNGIEEYLEPGKLNKFEKCLLESSFAKLKGEIDLGDKFICGDGTNEQQVENQSGEKNQSDKKNKSVSDK